MNQSENALVLMAKAPDRERVKTRLRGSLTDEERLRLYTCLLDGAIERLRDIPGVDTFISYTPQEAERRFADYGLEMFPQPGGDLGRRMIGALHEVIKRGYRKAAVAGVDIPELDARVVLEAFSLLEGSDAVFGPAVDGGYYLVGMKRPVEGVFEGIEWSTGRTLRQSLERAGELGLKVALTVTLRDIDTAEDLARYPSLLEQGPAS